MKMRFMCLCLLGTLSAFAADNIPVVTEATFNQDIKSGVVLVDFFAPWCGPCKQMSSVLDAVSRNLQPGTRIIKVNIDKSRSLMDSNQVSALPTLVLFKNGKEVGRLTGFNDQRAVENFINTAK